MSYYNTGQVLVSAFSQRQKAEITAENDSRRLFSKAARGNGLPGVFYPNHSKLNSSVAFSIDTTGRTTDTQIVLFDEAGYHRGKQFFSTGVMPKRFPQGTIVSMSGTSVGETAVGQSYGDIPVENLAAELFFDQTGNKIYKYFGIQLSSSEADAINDIVPKLLVYNDNYTIAEEIDIPMDEIFNDDRSDGLALKKMNFDFHIYDRVALVLTVKKGKKLKIRLLNEAVANDYN